jgi:hypothetical protein
MGDRIGLFFCLQLLSQKNRLLIACLARRPRSASSGREAQVQTAKRRPRSASSNREVQKLAEDPPAAFVAFVDQAGDDRKHNANEEDNY